MWFSSPGRSFAVTSEDIRIRQFHLRQTERARLSSASGIRSIPLRTIVGTGRGQMWRHRFHADLRRVSVSASPRDRSGVLWDDRLTDSASVFI